MNTDCFVPKPRNTDHYLLTSMQVTIIFYQCPAVPQKIKTALLQKNCNHFSINNQYSHPTPEFWCTDDLRRFKSISWKGDYMGISQFSLLIIHKVIWSSSKSIDSIKLKMLMYKIWGKIWFYSQNLLSIATFAGYEMWCATVKDMSCDLGFNLAKP